MPTFSNREAQVEALGLGMIDGEAVYVSAAGPKTALKSLWASLIASKAAKSYCRPWHWHPFKFRGKPRQFWAPLPSTAWTHVVFVSPDPDLLLAVDPRGALLTALYRGGSGDYQGLLADQMAGVQRRFVARLRQVATAPILDEWGPTLWKAARAGRSVTGKTEFGLLTVSAWGDCLDGAIVNAAFPWAEVVGALVRDGTLPWPQ